MVEGGIGCDVGLDVEAVALVVGTFIVEIDRSVEGIH